METLTQRSALDLYGGKGAVFERMDALTRQKLSSISNEYKRQIYAELQESGDSEKFIEFLNGKRKIDFETFDMFKSSYLEMEIDEVLGEPDLSDPDVRRYWRLQMSENPMLITVPKPNISKKELKELELHLYIRYRAEGELAKAA